MGRLCSITDHAGTTILTPDQRAGNQDSTDAKVFVGGYVILGGVLALADADEVPAVDGANEAQREKWMESVTAYLHSSGRTMVFEEPDRLMEAGMTGMAGQLLQTLHLVRAMDQPEAEGSDVCEMAWVANPEEESIGLAGRFDDGSHAFPPNVLVEDMMFMAVPLTGYMACPITVLDNPQELTAWQSGGSPQADPEDGPTAPRAPGRGRLH